MIQPTCEFDLAIARLSVKRILIYGAAAKRDFSAGDRRKILDPLPRRFIRNCLVDVFMPTLLNAMLK